MKKRKIKSLEVSEVGMGCMGFSHGYGKAPEREYSVEAIKVAYENGCTFFDTAEGYGKEQFYPGHNEELLGEAVKEFRDKVVIATKFRIEPEELESKSIYDAVRSHLEQSLKNLKTDYCDLYYLHRVNSEVSFEAIADVMGRLIEEGLIREWGLSAVSKEIIERANKITPVGAVQNIFNIVERDVEGEIIPYCIENDISLVPFSPVASGLLSGKLTKATKFEAFDDVRKVVAQLKEENITRNQPIVDVLKYFGELKGATPAQISLAWMINKYPNIIPIPGSKNKERIIENLNSSKIVFTNEELAVLEDKLSKCTIYGHRGCVEIENKDIGYNRDKGNK